MKNNHPQFRDMTGRLAQLFHSEEGERILRLITQLSGSPAGLLTKEPKKPADTPEKIRVGTWEATDEPAGRSFVRIDIGEPWHLWANVQKIPAKGPRRRVVLIGESTAKGYHYHPRFTVAQVLQQMMNAACGPNQIEVVDLARVNMLHDQLQELITQSVHLEPDALIVFAGNNWSPLGYAPEEQLLEMAGAFRAKGSWRGVKESCEYFLIEYTRETLRLLEKIGRERGIPVVFVLPEFNLADWITDCDSPPQLDSEQTEAWLQARSEAEQLLKGDGWEKAEDLGKRLIELDEGTTPAGFNILAEVSRKRGDPQAATTFLEMARDSAISWPGRQTPRCYSVIHQTVREEATDKGIHVVDLPREFAKHLGGEVVDLRLFLDYCHLTLEGIRVAMALTAETLLPLLKYPAKSSKELAQMEIKVGKNVSAGAHFLAAIYNANWGQRMDVVRHHIHEALRFDRSIADIMRLFIDFHIKRVPSSLCRSFEQLWESPHVPAIIVLYDDSGGGNFLNPRLVTAMAEALEEIGIPARSDVERLLIQEHGVKNRPVNLVDMLYSTDSYSRFIVDRRPEFYKATARTTTFPLICNEPEPLNFSITMKAPHASPDQMISVRLNGNVVAQIPATDKWKTTACSVPAAMVHAGVNQVEIDWPMPVWSGEKQRQRVADCLEAGDLVEITPIFGLIHSFRVATEEFVKKELVTGKARAMAVGMEVS